MAFKPEQPIRITSRIFQTGILYVSLFLFFSGPAFAASVPVNVSVSPSSGIFEVNRAYTFTATYQDGDGINDIRFAEFLIGDGPASIRLVYRNTDNRLSLVGDNGQWLAGYAPGSNNTLANKYVTLDCRATTIDKNTPNTLIVRWQVTFKAGFMGAKYLNLAVTDKNPGRWVGWARKGNITIYDIALVSFGQTVTGDISAGNPTVTYFFSAEKDDHIFVFLSNTGGESGFNVGLEFYDDTGNILASASVAAGAGKASSVKFKSPKTARYKIIVRDSNNVNAGRYALTLQRLNDPTGAVAVVEGNVQSAIISQPAEIDVFGFTAASAGPFIISLATGSWLNVDIYNNKGEELESRSDIFSGTAGTLIPQPGTYYICVTDHSYDGATAYNISIRSVNNLNSAPLSFGSTVTGTITQDEPIVKYAFTAEAGDYLYIPVVKTEGDNFQPYLLLFDPNGKPISDNVRLVLIGGGLFPGRPFKFSIATDELATKLPVSGRYVLTVLGDGSQGTGRYAFSAQRLNNPQGAITLTPGRPISSAISAPTEIDSYNFTASAANTLDISLSKTSGDFSPRIAVYDSKGEWMGGKVVAISDTLSASLPQAGAYYVYVTDLAHNKTGEYSIELKGNLLPLALEITSPADSSNLGAADIKPGRLIDISGKIENAQGDVSIEANGITGEITGDTFIIRNIPVQEGANSITVTARPVEGEPVSKTITVYVDTVPPDKPVVNDINSWDTSASTVELSGTKEAGSSVWINGEEVVPPGPETTWNYELELQEGLNDVNVVIKDPAGNPSDTVVRNVYYRPRVVIAEITPAPKTIFREGDEVRVSAMAWMIPAEVSLDYKFSVIRKSDNRKIKEETVIGPEFSWFTQPGDFGIYTIRSEILTEGYRDQIETEIAVLKAPVHPPAGQ